MSGNPDRPLMLGGQPMYEVVRAQARRLAHHLTDIIASQVETYRRMPQLDLHRDIVAIVEQNLLHLADMFERRRAPTATEMESLSQAAGRGARDEVPLEDILAAYHLGGKQAISILFADCDPEDYGDVVAAYNLLLDYNQIVSAVVCNGYSAVRESMRSQEQDARHSVVTALLNGQRPADPAMLAGVRLADRYLVMSTAVGRHPDEGADNSYGVHAGRSKLDRIRVALDGYGPEPVLTVLDTAGGLLLVPAADPERDESSTAQLVSELTAAAGAGIWAVVEPADSIGQIAGAARLTQEVLAVVQSFGHGPGVYRLSDVLLEYQLTRPSKALDELARLLDPLEDNPDLLQTLRVYIDCSLDRRAAAARLHVHPNTVDYRLRRAVQLTGLDPMVPGQLQRIGAALTARRAQTTG
ncbi:PucR-like helix-turn-helix protein [Stackebrandtia albiflava]|uniref:PucR-like helix-turn-helix protein n=1 Tax=Stackebrandtia albiflava TaxID=406432 RepID=A0A562V446_9ACTN|nr:helix-turn-helix domain-containing protein [Stackebrandtia albiflava]TWJ12643.1 PucR-like helix-turn-helix protein [Stackebrandtia albiflava]